METAEPTPSPSDPDHRRPSAAFAMRVLLATALVVGVAAAAAVLWYAIDVLLIVFAGILVAVLLRGLSDQLAKRTRLSPGWALAVVLGVFLLLAVSVGSLAVPAIGVQIEELTKKVPQAYGTVRGWLNDRPWGRQILGAIPQPADLPGLGKNVLGRVTGVASVTLTVVLDVILIAFVGLYLAAEPDLYVDGAVRLLPKDARGHARQAMAAVAVALRGWLVGQAVDMTFIGLLTGGGLWLVGVPLAFTLGLLAALANFIPNFGPIIAFVPSALLALTVSPTKVAWVAGLFLVIQGFEGYVLAPGIQRRTIALPPALTILAQVFLGLLLGPLGVVLATPLMAVAVVLVKVLYIRDVLHDPIEVKSAPPMATSAGGTGRMGEG